MKRHTVVLVDDHAMIRRSLAKLINSFDSYVILFEAGGGAEFKSKMQSDILPEIVLLDIFMQDVNGFELAFWLHKFYPQISIIALSMLSDEYSIIKMIKLGAKGYLHKSMEMEELKNALDEIVKGNVYLPEIVSTKLVNGLQNNYDNIQDKIEITEREKSFLELLSTELSYKEIAEKLFMSPRSIEDYRTSLSKKFNVHTRIGLIVFAIRNNLISSYPN